MLRRPAAGSTMNAGRRLRSCHGVGAARPVRRAARPARPVTQDGAGAATARTAQTVLERGHRADQSLTPRIHRHDLFIEAGETTRVFDDRLRGAAHGTASPRNHRPDHPVAQVRRMRLRYSDRPPWPACLLDNIGTLCAFLSIQSHVIPPSLEPSARPGQQKHCSLMNFSFHFESLTNRVSDRKLRVYPSGGCP